jgi:hypothetical protein
MSARQVNRITGSAWRMAVSEISFFMSRL